LALDDFVVVADTLQHIPLAWHEEVRRIAAEARARLMSGDEVFAARFRDQVESLQYTINTRDYSWDLTEQILITAAQAGNAQDIPAHLVKAAQDVVTRTTLVTPHYIGVNGALRTLELPGIIVRALTGEVEYVRLSVHAKPGEPRPRLAQSNRAARAALLPMHSLPVRYRNDQGLFRYAGVFHVEALANSWTAVLDPITGGLVYYDAPQASVFDALGIVDKQRFPEPTAASAA
jgi:hypothetical protein